MVKVQLHGQSSLTSTLTDPPQAAQQPGGPSSLCPLLPASACHHMPPADLVYHRVPIMPSPEALVTRPWLVTPAGYPCTVLVQAAKVANDILQGPAPTLPQQPVPVQQRSRITPQLTIS